MDNIIQEALISLAISLVALIVSVIALIYTIQAFLLKKGAKIRGTFSVCSDVSCSDKYVGSIRLENHKDRAVVIYKIFLKIGHSNFIEIENFESEPKILRPFEAYSKEFDPIDFYTVNMKRVVFDKLWNNKKIKQQLALSTSEGKYIIKSHLKYWDPVYHVFNNSMTCTARPVRLSHKGKAYGSNCRYIAEFKQEDKEEIIPIYPNDYRIKKFRKFSLTKESLESKEKLEEYLYDKASESSLLCDEIIVHDVEKWRQEHFGSRYSKTISVPYLNWFMYRIVGRIATLWGDHKRKMGNKKRNKKKANQRMGRKGKPPGE